MSQPTQEPDTARTALPWPAERHAAYFDSRPDKTSPYTRAADYGDPDWREPASDAEAAARTAYLREYVPPAPGWLTRPLTLVENALEEAQERAVLSDRAHDSDPSAWAEYQQLRALDRLAPLPADDELDDFPLDEHGHPDTFAAAGWRGEDQLVRDRGAPLRQRLENLRAARVAEEVESLPDEDEQRREQLLRWHDDDHRTIDTGADLGSSHETGDGGDRAQGWDR